MPGERWWDRAACAGRDPNWWQADHDRTMLAAAVALCLKCPVRDPCLAEAVANKDSGVVRGGMLVVLISRGDYQTTSLICGRCQIRPVDIKLKGAFPSFCKGCRPRKTRPTRPPTPISSRREVSA